MSQSKNKPHVSLPDGVSRKTRRALEKTTIEMDKAVRSFGLSPNEELDLYVNLAALIDDRCVAEMDEPEDLPNK